MPRKIITFRDKDCCERCRRKLPPSLRGRVVVHAPLPCMVVEETELPQVLRFTRKKHLLAVEDDITVKTHGRQVIPWGVRRLQATRVWRITKGNGVKVAVMDTGIARVHPDLRGRVKGGTAIVGASPFIDENGHGTHVAGTITAVFNAIGVVGVAPLASLYSVKAFAADGTAKISDLVAGVAWSIANGMKIINMSFGTKERSNALHQAVKQASERGIVITASAGNDGGKVDFPAAFPEAIAVGAVGRDNTVPAFSNRGPEIDFVAPGVDILSTWPFGNGYRRLSGTSMATAHLSGATALILSRFPGLHPAEVKRLLREGAVPLPRVAGERQGAGFVNLLKVKKRAIKFAQS
ncbi:S8 family peptidase [Bacillaceae bacterium]